MIKDKEYSSFIQWFTEKALFYIKERKSPRWPYRYRHLQPSFYNLKKNIIKNYPLPIFLNRFKRSNGKIVIINKWLYWMQYLESILLTDDRFILRSDSLVDSNHNSAPPFNVNDPDTLNIVIGAKEFFGSGDSSEIFLTKWHRVLVRFQHSPGFGLISVFQCYDWVKENRFKLMVPKIHWDIFLKSNSYPDHILKLRDGIINDGIPLAFTNFEPKLNRIFNSPRLVERKLGAVLISCNFRIGSNNVDIKRLLVAIDYLSKYFKITINLHPFIKEFPGIIKQPESILLGALQEAGVKVVTILDSVQGLVNLYDEHEFIVTDGSGTVYEAIARGCKALTLDGLSYQTNKNHFHATVELGLLPKTLLWDYKNHPGCQMDMEWLKSLYSSSLVKEDVTPLVAQEIVDIFNNWHK